MARLFVRDGHAYSAVLIWPKDATIANVREGFRVLDALRLTDYSDVAKPVPPGRSTESGPPSQQSL